MAPGAAHATNSFCMDGMQVIVPVAAKSTGAITLGGVERIAVTFETQVIGIIRACTGIPVTLENKIVTRSMWAPGVTIFTAARNHGTRSGIGAVAVGAIHGLVADIGCIIPGTKPVVGSGIANRCCAAGRSHDGMPGAVVITAISCTRTRIGSRHLTSVCNRRLKFHRLVGVLDHTVGARRCITARVSQHGWVTTEGIVGMAFQAYLVLAGDMTAINRGAGAGTAIAGFYGVE